MKNTVLIQAAGEPEEGKWGMNVRKQMVPIAGEPLIVRTQRQCVELGYQPIVVSNHLEILAVTERPFMPKQYDTYLETFLSTRELWKGWVIILLGDVVWSDQALGFTLEQRESPLFIAPPRGYVHAWMFHEEDADMLAGIANALLEKQKGTLTDLYFRLGAHDSPMVRRFPPDGGVTRDFDRDRDYGNWLKRNKWARSKQF